MRSYPRARCVCSLSTGLVFSLGGCGAGIRIDPARASATSTVTRYTNNLKISVPPLPTPPAPVVVEPAPVRVAVAPQLLPGETRIHVKLPVNGEGQ